MVAQIIAYCFFCFIVLFFIYLVKINGKDFYEAIKGTDGKLQIPEIVTIVWLILFITIVLSEVFLEKTIQDNIWYSMDVIMLFILGGKATLQYVDKNKSN